jgi:hypothetical protein
MERKGQKAELIGRFARFLEPNGWKYRIFRANLKIIGAFCHPVSSHLTNLNCQFAVLSPEDKRAAAIFYEM